MGTLRISVEVENPARLGSRRRLDTVLVDTGTELSWFPAESLEGLNLRVDSFTKKLVDGGPVPAAAG